jgi:hypothetical protein
VDDGSVPAAPSVSNYPKRTAIIDVQHGFYFGPLYAACIGQITTRVLGPIPYDTVIDFFNAHIKTNQLVTEALYLSDVVVSDHREVNFILLHPDMVFYGRN